MKKLMIGLVLLTGLVAGLTGVSFAEQQGLFLFTDAPLLGQQWSKATDGSWHIDRGVVTGLHGVLKLDEGVILSIKDGIIMDAVGGQQNPQTGSSSGNQGLGFGAVGNKLDLNLKVGDPNQTMVLSINYGVKSWFVGNNDITYGPEYLISPSTIVQSLVASVEIKLF